MAQGYPVRFLFDPRRHETPFDTAASLQDLQRDKAGGDEQDIPPARNDAQLKKLTEIADKIADAELLIPLGDSYKKTALEPWDDSRAGSLSSLKTIDGDYVFPSQQIYLFNIIVAIEWIPSRRYLAELADALTQASDLLFDATDGQMAIGQVVIGDRRYMRCADIQILASNRYYPRSWVDGLVDKEKYTPIRIGRGWWDKNLSICVPWSDPIGPRVLVHEWCHYALGLKDEYMTKLPIQAAPESDGSKRLVENANGSDRITFVRPVVASESLMDNLEGASEIIPQGPGSASKRREKNEAYIKNVGGTSAGTRRFGGFNFPKQVLPGPTRLPLDLPAVFLDVDGHQGKLPEAIPSTHGQESLWSPSILGIHHAWVYVLRRPVDKPPTLIPQGTLDAHATQDGFRLLGAENNDTLLIIGTVGDATRPSVWTGALQIVEGDTVRHAIVSSVSVTQLPELPVISVIPEKFADDIIPEKLTDDISQLPKNTPPITKIQIQISGVTDDILETPSKLQAWVFPLGEPAVAAPQGPSPIGFTRPLNSSVLESNFYDIPSLDGQVLLEWDGKQIIAEYSQGGGPTTHVRSAPEPPISAGSSDGNLMLYFSDPGYIGGSNDRREHSRIRIVTTRNYGGFDSSLPGSPRSYLYSVASNMPVPVDGSGGSTSQEQAKFYPTLAFTYNQSYSNKGELYIYEYKDGRGWGDGLLTYLPQWTSRAAHPLGKSARMFALDPNDAKSYHFRLFLVDSAEPATQT